VRKKKVACSRQRLHKDDMPQTKGPSSRPGGPSRGTRRQKRGERRGTSLAAMKRASAPKTRSERATWLIDTLENGLPPGAGPPLSNFQKKGIPHHISWDPSFSFPEKGTTSTWDPSPVPSRSSLPSTCSHQGGFSGHFLLLGKSRGARSFHEGGSSLFNKKNYLLIKVNTPRARSISSLPGGGGKSQRGGRLSGTPGGK